MQASILSPNLSGDVSVLDCGVTNLATYVNERTDHSATIWDYTFNSRNWQQYLTDKFYLDQPDVIGITFTTLYKNYIEDTISHIRGNLSKDIPIILGGVHPTLHPEDGFTMDGVDVVVVGEGEPAFHELLDAMEGGSDFDAIKGIWYRKDGEVVSAPPRGWIADINDLPTPNYDLWDDIEKYCWFLQQFWMVGTRGCPYPCTHCEEVAMYKLFPTTGDSPSGIRGTRKRFRTKDPQKYAEEIAFYYHKYHRFGVRWAHPFDPVFPIDRGWTFEFCDAYIKTGLPKKFPITIFSRADCFYMQSPQKGQFDEDRLIALKEAGIAEIRVGIEAGSERMRNEVHKKGVTNEQIIETFDMCRKHGIQTISYNMLGGPTETKEELKETFRINRRIKPNKPVFFIYQAIGHDMAEMGMVAQDYNVGVRTDSRTLFQKVLGFVKPSNSDNSKSIRDSRDQGTILFGEPLDSPHFSKRWLVSFQLFCQSYFYGKRIIKCIWKQKHRFFINFFRVMYRGRKEGLNMKIVFAYFLSAHGDNLTT